MALNLGTITVNTSKTVSALSKDALSLISQIKGLEAKFNSIANEAASLGISSRAEGEGDLELLARIAREANIKAHTLAAEEDAKRVDAILEGAGRIQRRGLAGLLDRAADKVARF